MHPLILAVQERHLNPKVVNLRPGDTVRVHVRVIEGARERIQPFEGVVMRVRKGGLETDFTVRRLTHGIGVERTFLLHSPRLERIEILRHGEVRRAQLYYLRDRVGKRARIRELRASRARVAPRAGGAETVTEASSETPTAPPEPVEQTASEGGEG
ncbi:MAG: 50S ribosomal protein L19 [Chloroflexota bacterium]